MSQLSLERVVQINSQKASNSLGCHQTFQLPQLVQDNFFLNPVQEKRD